MDYTVTLTVQVTADSPEEAAKFAFDDLRDQSLGPWDVDVSCSRGKQTVVFDDSQAESPAASEKTEDISIPDEEKDARGSLLAEVFYLRKDEEHRDRFKTSGGTKTAIGVFATAKRIIEGR